MPTATRSDKSHVRSSRYNIGTKVSYVRQARQLLWKSYLNKLRNPTELFNSVVIAGFYLFILIMLNLSLSAVPQLEPTVVPLPKLSSLCNASTFPDCVHVAYTAPTSAKPVVDALQSLINEAEGPNQIVLKSFDTLDSIKTYKKQYPSRVVVGIDFSNIAPIVALNSTVIPNASNLLRYAIYVNDSTLFQQSDGVLVSGLATGQVYVERAIFNVFRSGLSPPLPPLRSPLSYTSDNGVSYAKFGQNAFVITIYLMPFYMILMLQAQNAIFLSHISVEKEKLTKAALILMGMNQSIYLLITVVAEFIAAIPSMLIILLLTYVGRLFTMTSPGIYFLILVLFFASHFMFLFCISVLVAKPSGSGGWGALVMIGGLVLHAVGFVWAYVYTWAECIIMLLPLAGLARGTDLILRSEFYERVPLTITNPSLQRVFIMLVVDVVLYSLLAMYLDRLAPGEMIKKETSPLYFLSGSKSKERAPSNGAVSHSDDETVVGADMVERVDLNGIDQASRNVVVIRNAVKEFEEKVPRKSWWSRESNEEKVLINEPGIYERNGKRVKVAVGGVSMEFHYGQAVALLGHNGAGKTTLISSIVQVLPLTSGKIETNLPLSAFGICPQHDMHFPSLTPREHIRLVAAMKGIEIEDGGSLDDYIMDLLTDLELKEKADERCESLSGGQKRKVSVGMAICGDPKMILLDEPTTGMDVSATLKIWALFDSLKANRVILLTTHNLEEAENVGDRIIVMSHGRIQAGGTPLFLKRRFGVGYLLHVERTTSSNSNGGYTTSASSHSDNEDGATASALDQKVHAIVSQHFPDSRIESHNRRSTTFVLPTATTEAYSQLANKLSGLFEDLKPFTTASSQGTPQLTVSVSQTTLEQVFVKLRDEQDEGGKATP
ncbi:hypothetical protein BJ742DRAFT_852370 [Cladochytrium replicatum]|nr:hypothetical protein BJ742DRAFT_852370 [Cladochytrium replicatum]